jgi:hypothetical protein
MISDRTKKIFKKLATPVPLANLLWDRSLGGDLSYSDIKNALPDLFSKALGPIAGPMQHIIPFLESTGMNPHTGKMEYPEIQSVALAGGLVTRVFHDALRTLAPSTLSTHSQSITTASWTQSDIDLWCSHDYLPHDPTDTASMHIARDNRATQIYHLIKKIETAMGSNIQYRANRSMLEFKNPGCATVQLLKARPLNAFRYEESLNDYRTAHEITRKFHEETVREFDLSICQCMVRFEPSATYYISPLALYGLRTGRMATKDDRHNCKTFHRFSLTEDTGAYRLFSRYQRDLLRDDICKVRAFYGHHTRTVKYIHRGFKLLRHDINPRADPDNPQWSFEDPGRKKHILNIADIRTLECIDPSETIPSCESRDYTHFDVMAGTWKYSHLNFSSLCTWGVDYSMTYFTKTEKEKKKRYRNIQPTSTLSALF